MAYLRLHHVNVTSDDLSLLTNFYGKALGLDLLQSPAMIATSKNDGVDGVDGDTEWDTAAKFFNAGDPSELQIHATQRQPYLLTENGIPFDDWGIWSVEGWYQIFFTDPAGNMIEIHQVMTEGES
jgi:glyoxylase I family protein